MDADERLQVLLRLGNDRPDPERERWSLVEKRLGLCLPASYKNMIDQFGESRWGDFLNILCPFSEIPNLNLMKKGQVILEADRTTRESWPAHYPLPLYPEAGGLLPWAATDNGDTLYWITEADPNEWPTVIKEPRAPEFEVKFMRPLMLVHAIALRKLRSAILPFRG
jgi:hypothetical protein